MGIEKKERWIRKVSSKRAGQLREYKSVCAELDEIKPHVCFFCGKEIREQPDHHHLKGREGDRLVAMDKIVKAHRKCHRDYHSEPMQRLQWFDSFLMRLRQKDYLLWEREMWKYEK